jgi:dolichol-phosphate mannosyltransferase
MRNSDFWVVMPVYNEQEVIIKVINDWLRVLREIFGHGNFVMCILNDGSSDCTREKLDQMNEEEILVIDKDNTGHGQTCVYGYRIAVNNGATWVFQIDSDGQCDPKYFRNLYNFRTEHKVIYGYRAKRLDGVDRFFVSRFVSVFTYFATRVWVKDANVPYRLMHRESLLNYLSDFPKDFHLANILLSVLHAKYHGIFWCDIVFRQREGGVASVKTFSFLRHGFKLFVQLRQNLALLEKK